MTDFATRGNGVNLSKADVLAFYAHITQSLSASARLQDAVKSFHDEATQAGREAPAAAELEALARHLLSEVMSEKDIGDVVSAYVDGSLSEAAGRLVEPAGGGGASHGGGSGGGMLRDGGDTQKEAVQLLNAIPFGVLLGGPLTAAVDAQTRSSMATLNFIMTVLYGQNFVGGGLDTAASQRGLGGGTEQILYVKFTYETDAGTTTIQVPLLTILPIPYLQVDNLDIDFVAKIAAVTTDNSRKDSETKWNGNTSASTWWGRFNIDTGITSDVTSHSDSTDSTNANYEMNVRMRASQGEMPGGMARILGLLEDGVRAKTSDKQSLRIFKPSDDGYKASTLADPGLPVLNVPDGKTLALVASDFSKATATAKECLVATPPTSGINYKLSATASTLALESDKRYKLALTDSKAASDGSFALELSSITIKIKA